MKSKQDILALIQKTMAELFEIDPASIIPTARLYEDLDIDSIDAVDLIVRLKDITGKKPDVETFKQVRTVEDLVNAVHQHVNK